MPRVSPNIGLTLIKFPSFLTKDTKVIFLVDLLVRLLREELQLLQEQGSYVGEVVRVMDKKKVLVKVSFVPLFQHSVLGS